MPQTNLIVTLLYVFSQISPAKAWFPAELPDYCSKDMSTRQIPVLTQKEQGQINQLIQVQVLIRHGARTPYMKYSCWKEYDVQWNHCNVTEVMYTSPSPYETSTNWLFRKKYDGSPNSLGGNCKTGQLLEAGYEQEEANGRMLREAYIGPHKYNLLKSHQWEHNDPNKLYFRSDDEQRTLMSGQSLVHSLFDIHAQEIIDWHTGDYNLDTLYPNRAVCPRLDNISTDAFASEGYLSSPIQLNKKKLESALDTLFGKGYWDWTYMIDCLMTTVCSGNEIPGGDSHSHVNNDESKMTQTLFNQLAAYQEFDYFYKYTFDDSFYSKLAMSNVVYMLRTRLEEAMRGDAAAMEFVLYAGHDTTIMPLLSVLLTKEGYDGKWAPYGALLSLELYSAQDEKLKYLFRLVYNGKPLVLKGCEDTLCDVTVLLDILAFGQKEIPAACKAVPVSQFSHMTPGNDSVADDNALTFSFFFVCFAMLLTASVSCSCSVFFMFFFFVRDNSSSARNKMMYSPIGTTVADENSSYEL